MDNHQDRMSLNMSLIIRMSNRLRQASYFSYQYWLVDGGIYCHIYVDILEHLIQFIGAYLHNLPRKSRTVDF